MKDGETVSTLKYDAFGGLLSCEGDLPHFRYTGKLFDDETGLQWNINRWYDAKTGRWISEDPIGFKAGEANLVRYVRNSVCHSWDYKGLISMKSIGDGMQFVPRRNKDENGCPGLTNYWWGIAVYLNDDDLSAIGAMENEGENGNLVIYRNYALNFSLCKGTPNFAPVSMTHWFMNRIITENGQIWQKPYSNTNAHAVGTQTMKDGSTAYGHMPASFGLTDRYPENNRASATHSKGKLVLSISAYLFSLAGYNARIGFNALPLTSGDLTFSTDIISDHTRTDGADPVTDEFPHIMMYAPVSQDSLNITAEWDCCKNNDECEFKVSGTLVPSGPQRMSYSKITLGAHIYAPQGGAWSHLRTNPWN